MSEATPDRPRVYGRTVCEDCDEARRYFDEQGFDYQWIDIDADAAALAFVRELNGGLESTPVIVLPDRRVYVEPSAAELGEITGAGGPGAAER